MVVECSSRKVLVELRARTIDPADKRGCERRIRGTHSPDETHDSEDVVVAKRLSAGEAKYFENLMDLHPRAIGLAGACSLHRSMLVVLNDAVRVFVETNDRIRVQ